MNREKNVVLTDACSPNMLEIFPTRIIVDEIDKDMFCQKVMIYSQSGDLGNALGRKVSAQIVNVLCGTQFTRNKTRILLREGMRLLVVLLTTKVDDNKELSDEEVKQWLKEGKIRLFEVIR
jgi:methylaspartate ammonia-lyase